MHAALDSLTILAACTLLADAAFGQSARDLRGPFALVTIENEAPPRIIVDPPLAEQLAQGLSSLTAR
jgi:uncharacterized protein DUF6130